MLALVASLLVFLTSASSSTQEFSKIAPLATLSPNRDERGARSQECCHHRKRRNVCVPLHPADRKRQVAVLIVRPSAVDWHAKQRDEERAADDRCESNRKIDAL